MRKNVKNDKVLRAITIGLATMIAATSVPVTVLADDGETAGEGEVSVAASENVTESSVSEGSGSNESSSEASQTAGTCTDMVNTDIPAAEVSLGEAVTAVEAITDVVDPADQTVVDGIAEGLGEVSGDIAALGAQDGELAEAAGLIGEALVADLAADKAAGTAETNLTEAGTQQQAFADADTKTDTNAQTAIDKADVANTSSSSQEAYRAKDAAEAGLAAAKKGLVAATDAYEKTSKAVTAAETALGEAVDEQQKAEEKLTDAKKALADANTNATAANERMKALQSQMDNLNQKVEDLAKQKEDLENLNNLYYKLMVHFYRDKNISCAKYEDGKLDIEESAQALKDSGKATTTLDKNTYRVGRALMAELIEFKLKANGVDPSTIHIGDEETKKPQYYDEGTLTKDNKNNDRVTVVDETKLSAEERAEWEKEHTIYFSAYGKGANGTANSVKVTYTVKDDNGDERTVTEYYNYEIKGRSATDELDFENGPIYLAQIDGEIVTRDTDANTMDDLRNLNKRIGEAMKAAQLLDEYAAAKAEVDEAAKLVDELTEAIDTLNKTELKISKEKVKNLEAALAQAKEDLEAAKERKGELEDKVDEAQAAVDSIDLSRFNTSPEEEEAGDDDVDPVAPAPGAGPAGEVTPDAGEIPGTAPAGTTTVSSTAGVAGVRTGATDEAEGTGFEEAAAENSQEVKEENPAAVNNNTKQKLVRLENGVLPLAAMPDVEDGVEMSWWWILVIFLFGATGKAMYDKYMKKAEAEGEAKAQNADR